MGRSKRGQISVKGLTYHRLKAWCQANGRSISGTIEEWSEHKLRDEKPRRLADLYVVELEDGELRFLVAPNADVAEGIVREGLGEGIQPRLVPSFDRTRITSWHYGLLSNAEAVEILGEKSFGST